MCIHGREVKNIMRLREELGKYSTVTQGELKMVELTNLNIALGGNYSLTQHIPCKLENACNIGRNNSISWTYDNGILPRRLRLSYSRRGDRY